MGSATLTGTAGGCVDPEEIEYREATTAVVTATDAMTSARNPKRRSRGISEPSPNILAAGCAPEPLKSPSVLSIRSPTGNELSPSGCV